MKIAISQASKIMLNILSATAVALQPIPIDYDLRDYTFREQSNFAVTESPTRGVDTESITDRQIADRTMNRRRYAFHILNATDFGLTLYCLENQNGCREQNPIYGQSRTRVIVGKIASSMIYELILNELRNSGDREAIQVFQWATIAIQGSVVTWNITVVLR
jgi:hypothetical protein